MCDLYILPNQLQKATFWLVGKPAQNEAEIGKDTGEERKRSSLRACKHSIHPEFLIFNILY